MMNIDNIDMWLTIVSIICTLVSIGFSIISIHNANKAKDYKEKAQKVLLLIDIQSVIVEFENESKNFINNTREKQWYKGKDPNMVIKPLDDILMKFGSLYSHIDNNVELKNKVHLLSGNISNFEKADQKKKQDTKMIIYDISELLHNSMYIVKKEI